MDAARVDTPAGKVGRDQEGGHATRVVGGIMLGAAAAALVQHLVPVGPAQPTLLLLVATLCVLSAWKLGRAGDAADAAGLTASLALPFFLVSPPSLGLVAAGLATFVTFARRGHSALALLAAGAFFVGVRHVAGVDMLLGDAALPAVGLFLALLGYAGYLALQTQQGGAWSGRAVALVGVLIVLSAFPLLDAARVTDAGVAVLCLGTLIGALLAAGIVLRIRALAATMGVILPVAILAFALLAPGPPLAAFVLLCLGSALLWQARQVRGFFVARGT